MSSHKIQFQAVSCSFRRGLQRSATISKISNNLKLLARELHYTNTYNNFNLSNLLFKAKYNEAYAILHYNRYYCTVYRRN